MKIIKSKCGKYDILVDDEDHQRLIDFAPNGWEAKYTTGSNYPYAVTRKTIDGKRKYFLMHRLVMNVIDSQIPHIDHINTEHKLDNRKSNLREVTRSQNMSNRKSKKTSASQYLGVTFCNYRTKRPYRVDLQKQGINDGKKVFMGYYDEENEAGFAYNCAAKIIHGDYANLNTISTHDGIDIDNIQEYVESRLENYNIEV